MGGGVHEWVGGVGGTVVGVLTFVSLAGVSQLLLCVVHAAALVAPH